MVIWERIELVRGDITQQRVDALVNAANTSLLGGGGVDGAIHRAAGPKLLEACRKLNGCPTGSAKVTPGFELAAKYVIHAVGPVYRGGRHGEPEALAGCYRTSIELARQWRCHEVAFAAISCGVYGYPLDEAARIALGTVAEALADQELPRKVRWVLFDDRAYAAFAAALAELSFPEQAPPSEPRP